MSPTEKKVELPPGLHSEIKTRNIVLQIMGSNNAHAERRKRARSYIEESLENLFEPGQALPINVEQSKKLKELLEKKGPAFKHTKEYYAAIEDERLRMGAYRDLKVVSTVLEGEDLEIAENPFKFLYLPEDATFAQVRDAYIRLSRKWFPDLIYPENKEQRERILGKVFSVKGKGYEAWAKELENLSKTQQTLDVEGLNNLSVDERNKYEKNRQAYREKEIEYENVKAEMRQRATVKMQILNKAYASAKKRFSEQEVESFAGFEWTKKTQYLSLLGNFEFSYDTLPLEGNGQLRKNIGKWAFGDDRVYLAFDFGDVYLADGPDYRQSFFLKSFFAWTELVQKKGLAPTLLDDITKKYKFNDDQAEQLRIMILNQEKPEFILTTLNIPTDDVEHYQLLYFLEDLYEGPTYTHQVAPREHLSFPLGVQFTTDESLILEYETQDFWLEPGGEKRKDQFSKLDVEMMRAIAYGPLLQEPRLE